MVDLLVLELLGVMLMEERKCLFHRQSTYLIYHFDITTFWSDLRQSGACVSMFIDAMVFWYSGPVIPVHVEAW